MTVGLGVEPLLRRALRQRKIMRAVDEADMREGLRKIAELALAARVVLLGEQSDIVAQGEQPLEHRRPLVVLAEQGQIVDEPEAAGEKRPLARRQAVDAGMR